MLRRPIARTLSGVPPFVSLLILSSIALAQVHDQHPYRQIILRTRVKVKSSRDKETTVRYSAWGNLSSSDRHYTQKVHLRILITNASGADLTDIQVQYRIYSRDLVQDTYSVSTGGQTVIPHIAKNETKTLLTNEATCEYRLRWNRYVRSSRLRRSGERYAGYVIIYSDKKGPISWDISSQSVYSEYVKELRHTKETSGALYTKASENGCSLPHSTATIVHVTRTGKKFHKENCRFVRTGARPISRAEALKLGYTACSVCNP